MPPRVRFYSMLDRDADATVFYLAFAVPQEDEESFCAPARLETTAGQYDELGILCAPTAFTWQDQGTQELARFPTADGTGQPVRLRWGDLELPAVEAPAGQADIPQPQLDSLIVQPSADTPLQASISLQVRDLHPAQKIRIDGGAGQSAMIPAGAGAEQRGAWIFDYVKPGDYEVVVDLLDQTGFRLAGLARVPLQIAEPIGAPQDLTTPDAQRPTALAAAAEAPSLPEGEQPWLPFRYARPLWSWCQTFASPGGNRVVRQLAPGTYVSVHAETLVGGAVWYRTGSGDWIAGSSVALMPPSTLRGILLDGTAPPPPPPPPPPSNRRGVITATVLNVRAHPGVWTGNPPIDRLPTGAEVTIYNEDTYAGDVWYRIGSDRWVHSAWVRVINEAPLASLASPADVTTLSLPAGWVFTSGATLRTRPVDGDVAGQLAHNACFSIVESRTAAGQLWHAVSQDRWAYGPSIRVARQIARPASIGTNEKWVAVDLREQTLVAYEGDRPVYAAMVATGLPGTPTVRGIFRTWLRRSTGKMSGGRPGAGYYYLEDVTWTCFFYSGYGLHTAYWHDAFGQPRSHGCVNMSPYDAWWVYEWTAADGPRSPAVYVT